MSLNYGTYISQIANMTLTAPTSDLPNSALADTNFALMAPGMIDYAEQRIYRELDLLATRVADTSQTLTANSAIFTLPTTTGTFLVIEDMSITTATGRKPLLFTSKQFLDEVYPSDTLYTATPRFAAMYSDTQVLVGPTPDSPYPVEVVGTQRPTPLSASNSSTFLTKVLPDLFYLASMVFVSGYMRDFGQTADTPQMGVSWEQLYMVAFKSANAEEMRKKYIAPSPGQAVLPPPKG